MQGVVQERVNAKMALVAQVRDAADALMHDNGEKAAALADAERTHQRLRDDLQSAQHVAQQRESDIAELGLAVDLVERAPGMPALGSWHAFAIVPVIPAEMEFLYT